MARSENDDDYPLNRRRTLLLIMFLRVSNPENASESHLAWINLRSTASIPAVDPFPEFPASWNDVSRKFSDKRNSPEYKVKRYQTVIFAGKFRPPAQHDSVQDSACPTRVI